MIDLLGMFFITAGMAFNVFGTVGLVRMPDLYNRLQAATKCVTLGTCSVLFGVFLRFGFDIIGIKALLSILFILMTSPAAAHAIARGAYIYGVKLWEKTVCDKYHEVTERQEYLNTKT